MTTFSPPLPTQAATALPARPPRISAPASSMPIDKAAPLARVTIRWPLNSRAIELEVSDRLRILELTMPSQQRVNPPVGQARERSVPGLAQTPIARVLDREWLHLDAGAWLKATIHIADRRLVYASTSILPALGIAGGHAGEPLLTALEIAAHEPAR
jgi:hypothetical protein